MKNARIFIVTIILIGSLFFIPINKGSDDHFDSLTWEIEVIESLVGCRAQIELDSNGVPHICYRDISHPGKIIYANRTGGSWNKLTIEDAYVWNIALKLDNNDKPHVLYSTWSPCRLKYATWNKTQWDIEIIKWGNTLDWSHSLYIDKYDNPHICYEWYSELYYAKKIDNNWEEELVNTTVDIGGISLAIDNVGLPQIMFFQNDLQINLPRMLIYVRKYDNVWNHTIVDYTGNESFFSSWSSLVLDELGKPHICYMNASNSRIKYARLLDIWNVTTIAESNYTNYNNLHLILDNNFSVHILHSDNLYLYYSRFTKGLWQSSEVAPTYEGNNCWASMVIDDFGHIHIAYDDQSKHHRGFFYTRSYWTPSAPKKLMAIANNRSVNLFWEVPDFRGSSNITDYRIYRGSTSDHQVYLNTVNTMLNFTDTNLTNGKTYFYRVTAKNSHGESISSNVVNATPRPDYDSDLDGLPDDWEIFYFDNLIYDSSADPDEDGYNNSIEYQMNSAPNDSSKTPEDYDGDGVPNYADDFPFDNRETQDTDNDGIGNNADTDDDNDGVPDENDEYPLDPFVGEEGIPGFDLPIIVIALTIGLIIWSIFGHKS